MSLSQAELEELVQQVIMLYNRVRVPEVTAKLILPRQNCLRFRFPEASVTVVAYLTLLKDLHINSKH